MQSLKQALLVAKYNALKLKEILDWSGQEGKAREFAKIRKQFVLLQQLRKKTK